MSMIQIPIWVVCLFLGLSMQLLIALFCRRALGSYREAKRDLAAAVSVYLTRSNRLYLVGRVRRANGDKTVWDVMGLFTTESAAKKACTSRLDFYLHLKLNEKQDDKTYRPAPVVFPLRKDKAS